MSENKRNQLNPANTISEASESTYFKLFQRISNEFKRIQTKKLKANFMTATPLSTEPRPQSPATCTLTCASGNATPWTITFRRIASNCSGLHQIALNCSDFEERLTSAP